MNERMKGPDLSPQPPVDNSKDQNMAAPQSFKLPKAVKDRVSRIISKSPWFQNKLPEVAKWLTAGNKLESGRPGRVYTSSEIEYVYQRAFIGVLTRQYRALNAGKEKTAKIFPKELENDAYLTAQAEVFGRNFVGAIGELMTMGIEPEEVLRLTGEFQANGPRLLQEYKEKYPNLSDEKIAKILLSSPRDPERAFEKLSAAK